jgi:hypothetical protein
MQVLFTGLRCLSQQYNVMVLPEANVGAGSIRGSRSYQAWKKEFGNMDQKFDRKKVIAQLKVEIEGQEAFVKFLKGKIDPASIEKQEASIARQKQLVADIEAGIKP